MGGRNAVVMKFLGVLLLSLLLLIPLSMIEGTLAERMMRRNAAVEEITSTWGKEQTVVGPVLVVPYRYYFTNHRTVRVGDEARQIPFVDSDVATAHFLPASMRIESRVNTDRLHRSIYEAVVYRGELELSGSFSPDLAALRIPEKDLLWNEAILSLSVTDLRGAQEALRLHWDGREMLLTPGTDLPGFAEGVHASLAGRPTGSDSIPFRISLTCNGSRGIRFAPIGIQNSVRLVSSWPDPSFQGAFLPTHRSISAQGFEADWRVSYYGRSFPQQWSSRAAENPFLPGTIQGSLFGVNFVSPIDSYRNVERSIKYGVLFIVLLFTAFFLFEILSHLRIHPFQYLLVGAALCLFYLLLLSLSEFLVFGASYLAASICAAGMITRYSATVLRSGRRAGIICAAVTSIYGFLYVTLQLQDFALLFGSVGLFVVLGIVMYVTRNIDWYARDQGGTT